MSLPPHEHKHPIVKIVIKNMFIFFHSKASLLHNFNKAKRICQLFLFCRKVSYNNRQFAFSYGFLHKCKHHFLSPSVSRIISLGNVRNPEYTNISYKFRINGLTSISFYVVFFINDILTVKSAEFENFINYFRLCARIKQNVNAVRIIKDIEFLLYVIVTPNSLFIFIYRSRINQIVMIFSCTSFTRNLRVFRSGRIRNLLCCLFCRRLYFTL